MDLKKELGKKIRHIRESLNLSRELICDDESELTIRQLSRIEKGESLPTLPKLEFISKKLKTPITQLIDNQSLNLSQDYLLIKDKIISTPIYGDNERIKMIEDLFETIYQKYYEYLPEEEQLVIDVLNVNLDIYLTKDGRYGEAIINEYMHQIMNKENFELNDLIISSMFLNTLMFENKLDISIYRLKEFNEISKKILKSVNINKKIVKFF